MDFRKLCNLTAAVLLLQVADAIPVNWEYGGTDSEWNTAENWIGNMLPGTERVDIAVFAGGKDIGEVNRTVRSAFPVDLTMRFGASLIIGADMKNLRNLRIASTESTGTTAIVHTSGTVTSSGFLKLGELGHAMYSISDTASLHLAKEVVVGESGVFSLSGSSASVSSGGAGFSLEGTGELQFTFDATGIGTIAATSKFSVDPANSKLTIDLSAFKGVGSFELVTFYSLEGPGFANENVSITGLGLGRTSSISYERGRMILEIKARGDYVDIPEPSSYPLLVGLAMMAYAIVLGRRHSVRRHC